MVIIVKVKSKVKVGHRNGIHPDDITWNPAQSVPTTKIRTRITITLFHPPDDGRPSCRTSEVSTLIDPDLVAQDLLSRPSSI